VSFASRRVLKVRVEAILAAARDDGIERGEELLRGGVCGRRLAAILACLAVARPRRGEDELAHLVG
jgi:hypothetical protein